MIAKGSAYENGIYCRARLSFNPINVELRVHTYDCDTNFILYCRRITVSAQEELPFTFAIIKDGRFVQRR